MKKLRYRIFDAGRSRYLRRVELPDGDAEHVVTAWTGKEDRALCLPGVKSARALRDRLSGGRRSELIVINGKGETVA